MSACLLLKHVRRDVSNSGSFGGLRSNVKEAVVTWKKNPKKIKTNVSAARPVDRSSAIKVFLCSMKAITQRRDGSESTAVTTVGRVFALRAFLKAHEKLHEESESSLTHGCTLCPRRFRYKGSLDAHMRHHTSQVTYKCPVCEEVYEVKGELSQHVKAAHAGSKLVCSYCDKSFVRVDAFFKHIDRHVVVTPYYCSTCKVYQLTERGYLCHMRIHEKKRLLRLNAQKGPEVDIGEKAQGEFKLQSDSETHLTPGALSEPVEEPVRVHIETEEGLELEPELMVGAESVVQFEETGTDHIVPESNLSLPSPQELSYTDTSEDTDDMD
ncbi:zinc finger protein 32 [Colossoma macropomum]|uniref:zinc finger protein 32 n=1 Tax=Colossoma macropomum TaxID=42526 RepID=UPI0018656352|nr:zinc finger protein 32 [Colossoma macropomum]